MGPRPIKTQKEYDAALARIDKLLDAKPEYTEGKRLKALLTTVSDYEMKRWPIESAEV